MTTCAYDGKILAADSRVVGNYTEDFSQKIFKVGSTCLAVCGDYSACLMFVRWYRDQTKPKPELKNFEALVVKVSGKVEYFDENIIAVPCKAPISIGSGSGFAMGAMYAGKNAKEAIAIAKKLDSGTGGRTRWVTIKGEKHG